MILGIVGIILVAALITTGIFLLKPDMKSAAEVKYDGKKINLFTTREEIEKKIGQGDLKKRDDNTNEYGPSTMKFRKGEFYYFGIDDGQFTTYKNIKVGDTLNKVKSKFKHAEYREARNEYWVYFEDGKNVTSEQFGNDILADPNKYDYVKIDYSTNGSDVINNILIQDFCIARRIK